MTRVGSLRHRKKTSCVWEATELGWALIRNFICYMQEESMLLRHLLVWNGLRTSYGMEDSHDRYFHTSLLWLPKWVGRGVGDSRLQTPWSASAKCRVNYFSLDVTRSSLWHLRTKCGNHRYMESVRLVKWPVNRVYGLFRVAVTNDLESLIGCMVNTTVHNVVLT
jgi:hypothetical protein